MSKNIIEIWKENGEKTPFKVRRDNWSNDYYTVVEKVEVTKYPYGKAYGYPTKGSIKTDHYNYDKTWRSCGVIPCCGCYQWTLIEDSKSM